jgi:hypothetical protein
MPECVGGERDRDRDRDREKTLYVCMYVCIYIYRERESARAREVRPAEVSYIVRDERNRALP